jgi:hypothetical protein
MSKIFYDHLIIFEEVELHIKDSAETKEEKEELWQIVDEIVHHRVLHCLLEHLPHDHHQNFLEKYHECPYDEALLDYLNEKIEGDVEKVIKKEISGLEKEILKELEQD